MSFRYEWVEILGLDDSPFHGRSRHATCKTLDGSIYILGGVNPYLGGGQDAYLRDVWRSDDGGASWVCVNELTPMVGRAGHDLIALLDGSLIMIGGVNHYDDIGYNPQPQKDVWRSTDGGVSWVCINDNAPFGIRIGHHTLCLSDGSMIYTGGGGSDVWRSTDGGVSWIEISDGYYGGRLRHGFIELHDGSILIVGGYGGAGLYYNDVWKSSDGGVSWVCVNDDAPWEKRSSFGLVQLSDDSIVLFGGHLQAITFGDVWRSWDYGATWKRSINDEDDIIHLIGKRRDMSKAVHPGPDNSFTVIGGFKWGHLPFYKNTYCNDVWYGSLHPLIDRRRRSAWVAWAGAPFSGAISGEIRGI